MVDKKSKSSKSKPKQKTKISKKHIAGATVLLAALGLIGYTVSKKKQKNNKETQPSKLAIQLQESKSKLKHVEQSGTNKKYLDSFQKELIEKLSNRQ
jgi:uncharacterized membrane protein YebE (DUF533 family)